MVSAWAPTAAPPELAVLFPAACSSRRCRRSSSAASSLRCGFSLAMPAAAASWTYYGQRGRVQEVGAQQGCEVGQEPLGSSVRTAGGGMTHPPSHPPLHAVLPRQQASARYPGPACSQEKDPLPSLHSISSSWGSPAKQTPRWTLLVHSPGPTRPGCPRPSTPRPPGCHCHRPGCRAHAESRSSSRPRRH